MLAVLTPLNCGAEGINTNNDRKLLKAMQYYFSDEVKLSDDNPNYVTGDFNCDGI